MSVGAAPTRAVLRDRVVARAQEIAGQGAPWRSGIYPGEMAAFLGLCDVAGVEAIIESGRGEDAYSTQILGEYAEQTGVPVVSIGVDKDPVRGQECRNRLARYRHLRCLVGDTYRLLPEVAVRARGPLAILVDGPKGRLANLVSLVASCVFPVAVVGHHNAELATPWGREFARLFPGAFHYESLGLDELAEWRRFKRWEREAVGGFELPGVPGRSLSASSLALARLPRAPRSKWWLLRGPGARGRLQAVALWRRWVPLVRVR